MNKEVRIIKVARLFWSLVIGLSLTLGLSLAFALRPAARVHAVRPDFVAEPGDDAIAAASSEGAIRHPALSSQSPDASLLRASARPTAAQPGVPSLDSPRDRAAPLAPPMPGSADLAVCMTTDRVWGLVGAGETVTVTVDGLQMGADRADQIGFFWTTLYDPDGNHPDLDDGDAVRIYHNGVQAASVTLRAITGQVDVVNDLVSGVIGGVSAPISVTVYAYATGWDLEPTPTSYTRTVSTDAAGHFTADFAGIWDFVAWDEATVAYVDNGVEVHRHVYPTAGLMVRAWPYNNWVLGRAAPGTGVTVTLYLSDHVTIKERLNVPVGADGMYLTAMNENILESDVVAVELAGGTVVSRTIDHLTEVIDAAHDRITGEATPGALVRGLLDRALTPQGWRAVQVAATADAHGVYTLDFGGVADIMPGDTAAVFVADAEGDDLNPRAFAPSVEVNQTHNEVSGYAASPPGPLAEGRLVTLTLYSAAEDATHIYSKEMGRHGQYNFNSNDDGLPDIAPGDVVTVESEGFAWQGVVRVMTMTVEPDVDANRFTGEVVSPTGRVELSGHYYQPQLYPAGGQFDMLVTASSPFTATPPGFDVNGDLSYDVVHRTTGDYVERISRNTDGFGEVINANGVGVVFNPPGVAYTVTLYNSGGGVKTRVTGNSGEPTGWQWINLGDYGPAQIEVGDYLQGQSAAGFTHTAEIPLLSITGDPDTDIVSGQGPANALLLVSVDNHGQGFVPTDDSGQFTVAVDQLQELWGNGDLQWGDELQVTFYDERNTWLVYLYRIPTPEVRVNKWSPGGIARPGGKYVYSIQYWNDGNGVATDTLIVDTLPLSTTYAGDTSGVTPEIGPGGVITWRLGDLPPRGNDDNWGIFAVTVDVSDTVPDGGFLSPNCATISTSAPGDSDPGNDTSCTDPISVFEDDVNIRVDKWPNVGDPAPGQEFDYTIQWCSTSGASFGPVWLTDTLPLSTTLVRWWTDWPWNLWSEVVTTGGQLALYAPGLPGNFCQNIVLRLLLDPDAPPGAVLQNTVVVTTPHDRDDFDNTRVNTDAHVGGPRYDMRADKNINSSVLAPGGWIDYHISYRNQGNTAVHAWITDTLPAGTTYRPGSARAEGGGPAFPPAVVTDEYVVWDLGVIGVNQGYGLDFTVNVGDAVAPDTVVTNCATVGIAAAEDTPWDNTACVAETIHDHGPNLRVTKRSWWNGDNQLGYQIQFYNVGDQQLNNVWITDTLPISTAWDGWWNLGFDGNRLTSENLGSNVLMWEFSTLYPGDSGSIEFNANLDDPNARPRWYTNTVEIDTPAGDVDPADNRDATVDVKGEVERVEMWVAGEGSNMWGRAQPNAPITVTTALAQYTGAVNEWGDWNIDNVEALNPGATITVTAGAGLLPVVIAIPDPFTAYASSITDTVWGQIDALNHEQIRVDLYGYGGKDARTDGSGNYSVAWGDVPRGGEGHVRYETRMGYAQVVMHRRFRTSDLALNVNYGHDWVEGNYEAGHTVWLTVTQADGVTIKATAELTTGVIPWWGGRTGFSTNLGEPWRPQRPDIETGDWVYGSLDGVYTSSVRVGAITGAVDANADTVAGTVAADWFTQMLNAQCGVWEPGGPNYNFTVAPDGGSYLCDFSADWDLLPGHMVHVDYQEPDGDWVLNAFQEPTPHLRVQTWADGDPAEGGNFTFHVQYQNGGEADAEDVVITGTLQGATYLADTSGFPHTGGGSGPIVWELGTVAPGDWIRFDVFVQVTAVASDTIANAAQIATSNPYDQGDPAEKYSDWSGHVVANDTRLSVGKGAWTGDPASGYDMVFSVNICNHSGTASSQVTLTDTLHPSLTLQTWWGQYAGWQEVSRDDHHLVVTHPSIPGWWCSEVYVRAHLDENAWQGMPISNTAAIASANDLSTGDDETTWWGNVGSPHTNLYLNSQMEFGRLVPGGEIAYGVHYQNTGNVPVDNVRITVTLPASTTFRRSWYWTPQGEQPVAPAVVTADYVVWDLGTLDNGYGWNMGVALAIDSRAPVGTVLTSTATISPQPREDRYDDNSSTVVEVLHGFGPNLRVSKYYQWEGQGRLRYGIFIRNLGATRLENIWITDTYPLSTTSDGNFWVGHGPRYTYTLDAPNRQFVVWAESLDPGNTGHFGFWVDLDGSLHGVEGLAFTNTVAAPWPGDVYPADNTDVEVSYTGPDVYIEKWLSGGVPKPGAIVTFTVVFGNRNQWPWDGDPGYGSHITDTLPPEMTFVNATAPWDPSQSWMPTQLPGNVLVWDWGTMWSNSIWTFDVVVQITDTVEGGDVLTNVIAAYGDSPDDVEPFYDNNVFALPVTILNPRFEIGKLYESSRVAGMPVTYTLTVTNVGNEIATGVVVSDTLPAYLENVESNGTLNFGWLWWGLGPIAPDGGVDTAEFRATLPCTAGLSIVNADYGVQWSDQGVSGPAGAPVSFDVIAPGISAALTHTPGVIVAGDTVYFTATASTDGTPLTYEWDFGDGQPVVGGLTASHVYTRAGVYTAIFTATDRCGYSATATATVTVRRPALDADFVTHPTPPSILVGDTVLFTDTSITEVGIVAWAWDFGDGGLSAAQHPTHTYTSPGAFTVTLVVTDALGYSDVEVKPSMVAVSVACEPLTSVTFEYAPSNPVIRATVVFTAAIAPLDATAPITYVWNFGDGVTATFSLATVQHTYTLSGTRTVRVTAYNPCTPAGVSATRDVNVTALRVFLPVVLRNF